MKEVIEPVTKELFQENALVDTSYAAYESLDIVKGPDIPRFDQTEALLTVQIVVKGDFPDSDQEWEKMAALVKEVQHLSPTIDTTFNFIDKKKGSETFLRDRQRRMLKSKRSRKRRNFAQRIFII